MHESYVQITQLVMPNDTNPYGTLSGGQLMHWIDVAGGISATRHARQLVVTAAIDQIVFHAPIPEGYIVVLEALVTCSGQTSMEVKVDVAGEDLAPHRFPLAFGSSSPAAAASPARL